MLPKPTELRMCMKCGNEMACIWHKKAKLTHGGCWEYVCYFCRQRRTIELHPDDAQKRYQRTLELHPNYSEERKEKAFSRNPNYKQDAYRRELERNPALNKERRERANKRNPARHKEAYVRRIDRNPDYNRETYERQLAQNPASVFSKRAWARQKKYGISPEDYIRILQQQDFVCAICHRPERRKSHKGRVSDLAVDHNHRTGKNRALLCYACNVAIGLVDEDLERLRAMVDYLEKWQSIHAESETA